MQKVLFALGLSALAAASFASVAAADDRPVTSAEQASIGSILNANGFTSWKKIEFDTEDDKFEVDDARHTDGGVYDIDIRDGGIVKRERE